MNKIQKIITISAVACTSALIFNHILGTKLSDSNTSENTLEEKIPQFHITQNFNASKNESSPRSIGAASNFAYACLKSGVNSFSKSSGELLCDRVDNIAGGKVISYKTKGAVVEHTLTEKSEYTLDTDRVTLYRADNEAFNVVSGLYSDNTNHARIALELSERVKGDLTWNSRSEHAISNLQQNISVSGKNLRNPIITHHKSIDGSPLGVTTARYYTPSLNGTPDFVNNLNMRETYSVIRSQDGNVELLYFVEMFAPINEEKINAEKKKNELEYMKKARKVVIDSGLKNQRIN